MIKTPFFKVIAAFSFPLLSAVTAHAFEYKLVTPLSGQQKSAVLALLAEADQKLPQSLKDALSTVDVRFNNLDSIGGHTIGVANPRRRDLTLDNKTLAEIMRGPQGSTKTARMHKNMYNEILATVIHETTHLYDLANVHSDDEKEWIRRCDTKFVKSKEERIQNGPRPYACKYYEKMTTSFSGNPYFLQVAGWAGQPENGLNQRTPDIYEIQNPKEYLAVNMEYFLMDPQYKCRRPGMYKVLSSQFRHIPFQNINCDQQMGYVLPNSTYKLAQVLAIDPARVYQVHYLFAEKGADMSSGWGHAMIRLVVCAPDRKYVGPDCLRDVESHLVLSHRAFVDSLQINAWAGIKGDYPSRLFILPLNQVIDEYPKAQFRALRSLPLALTRQQIKDLIDRSLEIHWAYNGKYKFISNNCATETLDLLQSVLLSPKMINTEIKTPKGLYDVLLKQGLGNERVFFDQKKALELGYYFDSYEGRYQKTFQIIKDAGVTYSGTDSYIKWITSPAPYRQKIITEMLDKSKPNYKKVVAALFVLELAAQREIQTRIVNELTQMIGQKSSQEVNKAADNFLALGQLFAKPSSFIPSGLGYGIPGANEMAIATKLVDEKSKEAVTISQETEKLVNTLREASLGIEAEFTTKNIEILQKLLREK
ncbi:DUF4105 domain-containing protein [Bdellovibrio sp. HCB209]|uniref:DUF7844 domain-containing protein n=1 Tax=Bdellovibrio sp. HCB209 TaxID=3394354 RepID=UPI0039B42083